MVSSGYPTKVAVAVKPGGSGDVTDTKQVLWKYAKGTAYVPSPILYGDYVYLLEPGDTVKMQPVRTSGEVDASHLMVASGLSPGDKVVTEGQFRLKPGAKVTPMAPGEVPKAPSAEEIRKAAQPGQRRGGRR